MTVLQDLGAEKRIQSRGSRFEVCWWNGGGGLLKRLKINPILRNVINKLPEIFVYGESELCKSSGLFLKGYKYILHRSFIKNPENYRRGLVIFYREKYQYLISKVYSSKIFDIVWIRLKIKNDEIYFCFFYAPGAHLPIEVRMKFYHIFTINYDKFAVKGRVFLLGDFNARLGKFLNDCDINGNPVSNKNKPLF